MVQSANFLMDGGWDVNTLLQNLNTALNSWGSGIVTIIGLVMVIVGVYKIGKGLMSHGQGQVNWVLNIALIIIGGMLAWSGGWGLVSQFSNGAQKTINDLGGGGGGGAIIMDVDALGITTGV